VDKLDFKWWRCADGYRLERVEQRHRILPAGRQRPLTAEEEAQSPLREEDRYWIETVSARQEEYRPASGLYSIFADAPRTPEGMLDFANRYGLLEIGEPHRTPLGPPTRAGCSVSPVLHEHRALRHAVELLQAGRSAELTKYWNARRGTVLAQVQLKLAPDGRIQFALTPPSLIQAMWFQLAEAASDGAQLYRCERCGKPFTVGAGTGRRSTSKWCSNACKVAVYQEKKREARA
jgi:hypothetical protein